MKFKSCPTCEDSTGTCQSCNGGEKVDKKRCEDCAGTGEREDYN